MISKILSKTAITLATKKIPEKNFWNKQRLSSHTTDKTQVASDKFELEKSSKLLLWSVS